MKYTIYKTTNLITGKIYIGKHQTLEPNDLYIGSGVNLKVAIKKYGKQHFSKEVLYIFNTEDEMNNKEQEIITEEFISDRNNYNSAVGGEGGPHFKGRNHTTHTKSILREKRSKQKPISKESREKIGNAHRNKIVSGETRNKISMIQNNKQWIHNTATKQSILINKTDLVVHLTLGWVLGRKIKGYNCGLEKSGISLAS